MPTITDILASLETQLNDFRNETVTELEAESWEHEHTKARLERVERELIKQLLIIANIKQLVLGAEMRQISEQEAMGQIRGLLYYNN